MTDAAHRESNVHPSPGLLSIPRLPVAALLTLMGPLLVSLPCLMAGLFGFIPFAVRDADFWFYGPTGLQGRILKNLKAPGQSPRRVRFEQFEFA